MVTSNLHAVRPVRPARAARRRPVARPLPRVSFLHTYQAPAAPILLAVHGTWNYRLVGSEVWRSPIAAGMNPGRNDDVHVIAHADWAWFAARIGIPTGGSVNDTPYNVGIFQARNGQRPACPAEYGPEEQDAFANGWAAENARIKSEDPDDADDMTAEDELRPSWSEPFQPTEADEFDASELLGGYSPAYDEAAELGLTFDRVSLAGISDEDMASCGAV